MELFREIYTFFAKFTRKHLWWSLILIKLQVSILQLYWNKGLQSRFFLVKFARYLRHLFYRTPTGDYFCSTEKIFCFINTIVKNPLRKGEKRKQLLRKTTTQAKEKLNHYLNPGFISFYYPQMSIFLFSLLPMIYWKQMFLETMQSHWRLSAIEIYFSPSVWKNSFLSIRL